MPSAPSFVSLGVPENLARVLTAAGITTPFPIQRATLPATLEGRDVLGRGRTGSGKTLAFALPVVARLAGGRTVARRPRALILAPTRELATQIAATLQPLADAAGLRITTIFGGVTQHRQEVALAAGVDVVVACPGRLEDLLKQKVLTLDGIEITVLDEADHMADLGFLPGVKRLMGATPARGQRLLFSATLDNGVDELVRRFMHDPLRHSVDPAESPVVAMTHHLFTVDGPTTKREVVEHLASGTQRRLLFTRTKHQAKKLAKQLTSAGIPAVDLQGNLSQPARERNLAAFSSGEVRVLVATDIAARGIHVDDVGLVVHVDPPAEHKAYLHRSGRTARAGAGGDVVTLVLPEQMADVRTLTRQAKITATPQPVRLGSPVLDALVGEPAPRVAPTAAAPAPVGGNRAGTPRAAGEPGTGRGRRRGGRGRSGGPGQTSRPTAQAPSRASGSAPRASAPAARTAPAAAAGSGAGGQRRSAAVEMSLRGSRRRSR
ncbi:DEAD/DEAH box helicase [Actinotalea fermentans]|uniref:Putative ATP-dependent RNA helicase n=1 Tax=Actinotalea fermentans TaxID=43671 RepID=A0A511YTJ5_9CELL|nr:DEAD/DEAH box helicase [Actinotalea fermentans]GEN78519.1 putative ATP-dependent RNA helicase [Actinotalea fermentans]